jgi:hypothetical protein
MWLGLSRTDLGFMNVLDGILRKAEASQRNRLPDLRRSSTLLVTSDYSGFQKGSLFEVYVLLIIGSEGWAEWEKARIQLRRTFRLIKRRISFKGLNDSRKRKVLPFFLNEADNLPGLCVALILHNDIKSLFRKEGVIDLSAPHLAPYRHYDYRVFERLLRIVHFVSFFLAGLSRHGQDVMWFTDQDDIAANDQRVIELTRIWSIVFSNYLQHDLRHIRCGTTKCDNGTLQIEDLAAIPDLTAGALGELLNCYARTDTIPRNNLTIPLPSKLSRKNTNICTWLAQSDAPLKRLIYLIEEEPISHALKVKDLKLHGIAL